MVRLTPVWIALWLAVNDHYAGQRAVGLTDRLVNVPSNRIVIASSKVSVVRMQALYTSG
jgi:hypothetical protein